MKKYYQRYIILLPAEILFQKYFYAMSAIQCIIQCIENIIRFRHNRLFWKGLKLLVKRFLRFIIVSYIFLSLFLSLSLSMTSFCLSYNFSSYIVNLFLQPTRANCIRLIASELFCWQNLRLILFTRCICRLLVFLLSFFFHPRKLLLAIRVMNSRPIAFIFAPCRSPT